MNYLALLIGLGPLIGWGLFPTVASKIGGKPVNQILGTTMGTLIFAGIYAAFNHIAFPTGTNLVFALLSGVGWACAQIITFQTFTLVGSSTVMPITTAFQLLGASLWGVFALGDWPSVEAKVAGGFGLVLIMIGAYLTSWKEKKTSDGKKQIKKVVALLAIGEIGYWAYSAAPQAANITGQEAFLPQAIGMLIVAVLYSIYLAVFKHEKWALTESVSYKQIVSGFFFAFAALTYLISAQPDMNGLATGFILSQTSVVVATLTGIYVLGQKKTKKEMRLTILGLVLIIIAATLTVIF